MRPLLGPHARTDRTRDTRVAEPWLPAPEDGQPGEGQRLTPDAPHNGGRPPPQGTAPHHPRGTQPPRCMQAKGTVLGSPHPHTRACSTWVADLNSPLSGRAVRGGTAPDLRRPSQWWKAPPPRTPFRHPHSEQRQPARRTLWGRCWVPTPAPTAPGTHGSRNTGCPLQTTCGRGGGSALHQTPLTMVEGTPPGDALSPPPQRATPSAEAHSVGPVLGPHARTDRTRDTRVAEPRPPAPEGGQLGEGQRLTPDAPHNGGRPAPPGTAPHHPRGTQPPQGPQAKGTVLGPHTHTPATTACWCQTPMARPVSGQFGEGERLTTDAPHNSGRHPPGKALPPPPQRATPARKGAHGGAGAGSHARTNPTRDTRVADSRLPAPDGGWPGEGQRLTPDAPHNGGRPPPPGTAPHHPRGMKPPQGMQAKGTVFGPHTHTPAPRTHWWQTPTARRVGGQSGGGQRLTSDAPHNVGRHPPRGRPSATPTASNASPQGRTLWGRCWVPRPTPTAPGTHGSRNPGCPLQRMGGRGRDSA